MRVDWSPYPDDLEECASGLIDRDGLLTAARGYFDAAGLEADWQDFDALSDESLVMALAMFCPFEPREKQALLEAAGLAERAETLTAVMKMAQAGAEAGAARH